MKEVGDVERVLVGLLFLVVDFEGDVLLVL